jgi:L-asparaginase / beta-aspartyl-peptidase
MSPAIIVHGGAKSLPPEKAEPSRQGCLAAVRAGWAVMEAGGSALDAVEAAVRVLEDDPTFNAGFGSALNMDGEAQMDAGIMEGDRLEVGAVAAIEGVRHPISVARKVLEQHPVLIVGQDAWRFAAEHGAELCDPRDMISEAQRREWEQQKQRSEEPALSQHDTVGCVALDARGTVACGGSTGGTGFNVPGRVGDTANIGGGFYADGRLGACALTGDGEEIMRVVLAKTAIDLLQGDRHPDEATRRAIELLQQRVRGEAGCIMLDARGRIGWAHNSSHMPVAYRTTDMDGPRVFLQKQEEA